MYTQAGLLDLHQRTHQSFLKLMEHCVGFSDDELKQELEGFGYPALRLQLHHMMGAEMYWVGVLHGEMLVDEDPADFASIEALRAFHTRVTGTTTKYLSSADDTELNTPRKVITWGNNERELIPAHIILRTQTHVFQH